MTSSTAPLPAAKSPSRRAFTLVELLLVLALLAIGASLSAPRLAEFFRGRTLDNEARRLLSLTHLGAARASAEGRPLSLWFDPASGRYGLAIAGATPGSDPREQAFTLDADLALDFSPNLREPTHADPGFSTGSRISVPDIRFEPDGTIDSGSVSRVTLRQHQADAIDLVLTDDGLRYELVRHDDTPRR